MSKPEPLYLRWRGRDVRIRHDDPLLTRYSAVIVRLQSAMTITTAVATLRLVMARERAYDVQVPDDVSEVRLRRRTWEERPASRDGPRSGGPSTDWEAGRRGR